MKVGDYVRTKLGPNCNEITIRKIIEADENYYILDDFVDFGYGDSTNHIGKEDIIKSSPNITDLIEVGDYVNGYKVSFVDEEPVMGNFVQCDYVVQSGTTNHYRFYKADIKSIVAKEQFESMEYRL